MALRQANHPDFQRATQAWGEIAPLVQIPHSNADCEALIHIADSLDDIVQGNDQHPLYSLLYIISMLIEQYETAHGITPP